MVTKYRFQGPTVTRWYKPHILRVPGLLLVFAINLSLIRLLEYAARTLPSAEKGFHTPSASSDLLHLKERQIASFPTSSGTQFTLTADPNAYVQTKSVSTSTTGMAGTTTLEYATTTPGAYVQTTTLTMSMAATTTTIAVTIASGAYVKTTTSTMSMAATTPTGTYVQTIGVEGDAISRSWPVWKVFVGGYLPVLLAILFKVFWASIYANVRLIEPFIQLSRTSGALAKDAFWNFYLSSKLTPDPVTSLFKRRWLMFWTSIVYLIIGFLPPLASESLFRDTRYDCPMPDPAQPLNPCWPRLSVDPTIIRLLQGLLSFVAVMTLTIMYMISRSSTGISSDPSTIAFIASLIHHPDVLADFRRLSGQATNKYVVNSLGEKSYQLGNYLGSDRVSAMGTIISMNLKRLEREVQTLSPFHRLARIPSPAGRTILLRKYTVPFSAFVMLFAQGQIFSASMAFVGFLSEILVVILAAVPYSPGEIFFELILCTYTSIGILSVMLLVLISLVFWRRQLPYLPCPPDTLGGVITYLCDSRMLDNMDGFTRLRSREMARQIARLGKKYTYGEYTGINGQVRWMIEESTDSSLGEK